MDALTCSLAALLLATAVGPGHQLPVVVQDNPSLSAVLLFGQLRGAKGPQVVHVERQDPGTGAWVPVSVTGQGCDQGTEFSTDAAGGFLRLAPTTATRPTA